MADAVTFSTAGVPRGREVELWERHNAAALIALSCVPPRWSEFTAVELNVQLPRLHLARVRGSGHRVVRTQELVERHPTDSIAVYLTLRGEASFGHGDTRRMLRPGQLLVCDADRPFVREFGHGLDELAIKVPHAELRVPDPIVVDFGGPAADRHGQALARLVGGAVRTSGARPVADTLLLALVGALAGHGPAHEAVAVAYIDEHYAEPDLSAARVAAGTGISERQLSRIFGAAGTSVPRQVLARRLDAAYHLLATAEPATRIADIAARCGFTSTAHFAHGFRARFGIRARDVPTKC